MFPAAVKRPALGQLAGLGWVYDARSDRFLPHSVLHTALTETAVGMTHINTTDTKFSSFETLRSKLDNMNINDELSASFLAGMLDVEGAAHYLSNYLDARPSIHETLYYSTSTVHEKLNLACNEVRHALDFTQLVNGAGTHVVTEIQWGQNTVVAGRKLLCQEDDRDQVEKDLKAALRKLGTPLIPIHGDSNPRKSQKPEEHPFQFTVYTDVLSRDTFEPTDFESTLKFISDLPAHINGLNGGKGMPIGYTLLPVEFFSIFYGAQLPADIGVGQPSMDCQKKFVDTFDELHNAQNVLEQYLDKLTCNRSCVPQSYIGIVTTKLQAARTATSDLRNCYANAMRSIRASQSVPQVLWTVYETFSSSDLTAACLLALTTRYTDKITFVDNAVAHGAKYLGFGSSSFEAALLKTLHTEAYAFYLSETAQLDKTSWAENTDAFFELLSNKAHEALIAIVDTDALEDPAEKAYISHYKGAQLLEKDVVEQKKSLSDKNLMEYDDIYLDRSYGDVPAQRRMIKIPCPGENCDPNVRHNWICSKCHAPTEYSALDGSVYCDCGRCAYDAFSFRCKESTHGDRFVRFKQRTLLDLFQNLDAPSELNILILGSTGVGKSTFINAFVNYLTFASLDEGMSAAKLNCIIPCSFDTQYIDHANGGKLMQKEVRFGYDEDERSAKGQSATQKTTVYPLYIGNTLVRLIDTPGIGDTRGIEQDRKNMVDVLSVLRNYNKLHGILILLKPNESRLTVMFRFCVKELLVHLHRSCARNMVFGFTNTRGSNYQPGDTFRPLEALLSEYKDVIPGLFRETVYCFDSESFRYLAARQQGMDMGHIDDYRRSWDHSSQESHRLLAHFRGLAPHLTKATLSLNETRYLIAQLTVPMAEISKSIQKSIAVNEADTKALADSRLTGAALKDKLNLQKLSLQAVNLGRPRTVCSNKSCTQVQRDDVTGKEIILRKALCHNPCCLTDVPPDSVGTEKIRGCAAFTRGKCMKCKHGWEEHLHVLVEYKEQPVSIKDPSVERALEKNGGEIKAKELAIKAKENLIAELQIEHRTIQEAAAQFSVYLKSISITPYNDATLEYLDHLIKEERSKVGYGGSPERLDGLEKDRTQYAEFVKTMTQSIEVGQGYRILDADGVYDLVQGLYNLPHSGHDLKKVAKVVGTAYAATFREKPYRVRGRRYWMSPEGGRRGDAQGGMARSATYGMSGMNVIQEWGMGNEGGAGAASRAAKNLWFDGDEKGQLSRPVKNRLLGEDADEQGDPNEPPPYEADPTGSRSSRVHDVLFGRSHVKNEEGREYERKGWFGRKAQAMSKIKTRLSFG
ncbi:hypothetical protein DV736_g3019, partial [Chaetothyriales sp. CBS 134916]